MVDKLKEMQEKVPMRELLEHYDIYPKRSTNNYTCLFHSPDKHPSAGITKDGYRLRCYACGAYASIFDVVCKLHSCDYKTALKIIDKDFHLGILGQLTHKEKLELAGMQKERERRKTEKLAMERFEKRVLNQICQELRMWENCEKLTHLTRGEYKRGEWKYANLYFYSLEQQRWLNWLYETICGFADKRECEFDYIYGTDKKEILGKIRRGEILI